MNPPFGSPAFAYEFGQELLSKSVEQYRHKLNDYIIPANQHQFYHGSSFGNKPQENTYEEASVGFEVPIDNIRTYDVAEFYRIKDLITDGFATGAISSIFKKVEETCEEHSRVVNNPDRPEAFLETLRSLKLSVDEDGELVKPNLYLGSQTEIQRWIKDMDDRGAEFKERVEEILEEKKTEALASEEERLNKFKN
jgi:hypothetical protein